MTRIGKVAWLPLGLVAVVALAAVGLLAAANTAQADVTSLSVESKTVAPGAEVEVALTANATSPGIGAYEIKVAFNGTLLDASSLAGGATPGCKKGTDAALDAAVCNDVFVADATMFFTGGSSAGAIGSSVNLGTLRFKAGSTTGVANLTITIDKLTNPAGAAITPPITNGTITIAVATATPTASPTTSATAAPTTAAALPKTGGSTGDDSMSLTPWLLAALGLAVVGGGMWVVARTRRESL